MTVMNVRRRLIPAAAVAAAVALGLGRPLRLLRPSDAADGGNGGKLDVVASFYPMQFLAEQIGGEHVAVTSLTKPGQSSRTTWSSAPGRPAQLEESDVVLYLKGLQPAVDDADRAVRRRRTPSTPRR